MRCIIAAIALFAGGQVWAQSTEIKEIRFQLDPTGATKIRPGESIQVQAQVWGDLIDKEGNRRSGRLREVATIKVPSGQGFASKPLRFQGKDDGSFISNSGMVASIFSSIAGRFTEKDAILYTAPAQPGRYRIEAEKGSVKASLDIEVAADAKTLRAEEKQTFAKETDANPYRRLAEHWAPFIAQETWWQPKSDVPTRFDFDGDWNGGNNWDNAETGSSQAYVYYAAVETSTHWFLHYNFFHPRDYSDNCIAGTCHENDNEGIILTVRKDGSEFGKLELMETLAHNNTYSFTNESRLRKGVHNIDGKIDLYDGYRPMVFLEAGGHGAQGTSGEHSLYSAARQEFKSGTGITLVYRGVAERPKHANDRLVGYDLLPIESTWWPRTNTSSEKTFDAEYVYEPFGGRPGAGMKFQGSFYGRKEGVNKAKPFWGWHDERTRKGKVLNTGQWALDPAYAVTRNLTWPAELPVDLNYTYNPYLRIAGTAAAVAVPAPVVSITPGTPSISSPGEASMATSGSCRIDVSVDGSVIISVQQVTATYQVVSGQAERDANIQCQGPLPKTNLRTVEVRKSKGRGEVRLLEKPSDGNGFTASIRVDDPSRGADRYSIVLRWEP